jgi:hypothetical protein
MAGPGEIAVMVAPDAAVYADPDPMHPDTEAFVARLETALKADQRLCTCGPNDGKCPKPQ